MPVSSVSLEASRKHEVADGQQFGAHIEDDQWSQSSLSGTRDINISHHCETNRNVLLWGKLTEHFVKSSLHNIMSELSRSAVC